MALHRWSGEDGSGLVSCIPSAPSVSNSRLTTDCGKESRMRAITAGGRRQCLSTSPSRLIEKVLSFDRVGRKLQRVST